MIEFQAVTIAYGDRTAVADVSIAAAPGEFLGLLGPNGAGKTSLIRALCGLVVPCSGRITVAGLDPSRRGAEVARRLGLVPQELAFYPTLTARQNLVFFGRMHGLWGAALGRAVDRVLDLVQLADRADDRVVGFSGGMQRRLNVALGLLHDPAVLVLDEPTVGVDAQSRGALLDAFEVLRRGGTTVLYTTHLIDEAERLCDRVAIMDEGRIVVDGSPAHLIERFGAGTLRIRFDLPPPASLAAELIAASLASAARCEGRDLELVVGRPEPALTALAARGAALGLRIDALELPRPSLENVFLRLTGRRLLGQARPPS